MIYAALYYVFALAVITVLAIRAHNRMFGDDQMKFPTIGDVKHIKSDLTDFERHELINESRRMQQIRELDAMWVCHPNNAPEKGVYHPTTGARLQ